MERKNFPQKNFVEESLMDDVLKRYSYRYPLIGLSGQPEPDEIARNEGSGQDMLRINQSIFVDLDSS